MTLKCIWDSTRWMCLSATFTKGNSLVTSCLFPWMIQPSQKKIYTSKNLLLCEQIPSFKSLSQLRQLGQKCQEFYPWKCIHSSAFSCQIIQCLLPKEIEIICWKIGKFALIPSRLGDEYFWLQTDTYTYVGSNSAILNVNQSIKERICPNRSNFFPLWIDFTLEELPHPKKQTGNY